MIGLEPTTFCMAIAAHDATVPPNGALAAEAPVSQKSSTAGAAALVAPVEAVYVREEA